MKKLLTKLLLIARKEGVLALLKKVGGRIISPFLIPLAVYKLRKRVTSAKGLSEIVDLAYSFKVMSIRIKPIQIEEEILELLKILKKLKPKNILEIGTAEGGTLFLFSQVAHPEAKIISIDLPGGYPIWKIPLYKSFAKGRQKIYLLRADSHSPQTFRKVKEILGCERLDFLFIDGDHSYRGVKKDFKMYSKLVGKGKIIALHDIVPGPKENVGGVPEFWKKIKNKHLELVRNWNQGGYGIGTILI